MKTITAALLASAIAFPALAGDAFSSGDSYGPRSPNGQTEGYAQPAPKAAPLSWAEQPIAANGYANGYVEQSPGDLKANMAANKAAAEETYDRIEAQGGCSAPVRPVEFAVACDAFLSSHSAFGGDQSGQMGSAD